MEKKLFIVFFLAIPIASMILLTLFKMMTKNDDLWTAFESFLPIIIFYFLAASAFWVINLDKIKEATSVNNNKAQSKEMR